MAWNSNCLLEIRLVSHATSTKLLSMTILLDSNVVSELLHANCNSNVANWMRDHDIESLFFSTVGEAELLYGVAIMPAGRSQRKLLEDISIFLARGLSDRILPFDRAAARQYASIAATRRSIGRPVKPADCQIAAIARSRGFSVATRNVRDFEHVGLDIVNPWETD